MLAKSCRDRKLRKRQASTPNDLTIGPVRTVARRGERQRPDPTTRLLAEGLTALTEAIRELDEDLEKTNGRWVE